MADMENALWGADKVKSDEEPIEHDFVTAMIKGGSSSTGGPGAYTQGVDYGGNDMQPCGYNGCVLAKDDTHLACEGKCNATAGCAGYVFADASCSGKDGPICWTKSKMEKSEKKSCRSSRAMVSYGPGHWAIKGANAQAGGLTVYWDGARAPGYAPMKKQGAAAPPHLLPSHRRTVPLLQVRSSWALVPSSEIRTRNLLIARVQSADQEIMSSHLAAGGDNSDGAIGTFYEGAMTKGYSTKATDDALQANIVAAGYGK